MEEELNGRQRQLEREIECLKDTIWRLTSRVCVIESFLKNKHGKLRVHQLERHRKFQLMQTIYVILSSCNYLGS